MSLTETDPSQLYTSRRQLLVAAGLMAAGFLLPGCSSDAPTQTDASIDPSFLNGDVYKARTHDITHDPIFRSATGSLLTHDSIKKTTTTSSIFPYLASDGKVLIGTVGHAVDDTFGGGDVYCYFPGLGKPLAVSSRPQVTDLDDETDGKKSILFSAHIRDQVSRAIDRKILAPLSFANQEPAVGDTLRHANVETGKFDVMRYCGKLTLIQNVVRKIVVADSVLVKLGVNIPTTQSQLDALINKLVSGQGDAASLINQFVCSGDSGSPFLNAGNEVVGVGQSINPSIANQYNQKCGPLTALS